MDEELVDHYYNGSCHKLAKALHQKTSYPIFVISLTEHSALHDNDWIHVVVKLEEDEYVDITGVHSLDDLQREWGFSNQKKIFLQEMTETELDEFVGETIVLTNGDFDAAIAVLENL